MSSIYRIKENMRQYTDTESKIAKYILENKDFVITSSAQKVAKEINTSAAALVRFSKRIGYSGFTELKLELAKSNDDVDPDDFDNIIRDNDNLELLAKKVKYKNIETFENTYKLINICDLKKVLNWIDKAEKIFLFGIGGSSLICEDLYQKLVRINKPVMFQRDLHLGVSALSHASNNDVVITASYSGETEEVIKVQRQAKKMGLKTVCITQTGRTTLDRYSDISFKVPKEEAELRLGSISSRFSMLIISDLIYLGIAQKDIEVIREKIIKTKSYIEEYKE